MVDVKLINPYSLIRSALRRAWVRYPERAKALLKARRASESDNKRLKWEYKCGHCKEWFKQKDVQVDHIIPCGTFLKEEHWATFGPNLFCTSDRLQVLCLNCHKIKTTEERKK